MCLTMGTVPAVRGLIERVAFDQSVYSRDIIEGVIQKLTTVMVDERIRRNKLDK